LIYILYGKDDFSRHEALGKIKEKLGNPEMLAVNTVLLDGQQLSLGRLIDACSAVPFLCPYRLVVVQGLLGQFEQKSGQKRRTGRSKTRLDPGLGEWAGLAEYVDSMPSTTILALVDGEIKATNPLLVLLAPLAKVMTFPPLNEKELAKWIEERVKQRGGTISADAVASLIGLVGPDLWLMSNEIEKLLAFCSGRLITEEDVGQVTSYTREANIFALIDAIFEGRRKVAQRLLHQLLQGGAAPSYVLVMITRQLRLLIIAKELGQRLFRTETRDTLESVSEYALQKALKQAKAYTLEQVKGAYRRILEADIAIKTGKYDDDLALDLLVVELCQG